MSKIMLQVITFGFKDIIVLILNLKSRVRTWAYF